MESHSHERGAAQQADAARPRPSAACAPAPGPAPWKPAVKEPSADVKLTGDGQIVEAGYGHGV
jgi:hypothetical protein